MSQGVLVPSVDGQDHYRRLAAVLQDHTGIQLPERKLGMLAGRVHKRLARTGGDLAGYVERVLADRGGREFAALVDAITTNKTSFWREPAHFAFVRERLAGELTTERGPVRAWSAGCSSGEEIYSLAMVLSDGLGPQRHLELFGSDLSTRMLVAARTAIYPASAIAPLPQEYRRRYLLVDQERRRYRVVPALRHALTLERRNLIAGPYHDVPEQDLIFCRNVLIYFDRATRLAVIERLLARLRPGGWLFLGHSEGLHGSGLPLQQLAPSIYRKPLRGWSGA